MRLEEYQRLFETNKGFTCQFKINQLGTLMYLDGPLKVVLDEKYEKRDAEQYIDADTFVTVSKIVEDDNTVYVSRGKSVTELIYASIEKRKSYKCEAIVRKISSNILYADICGTELKGYLYARNWRKNSFIRDIREKCKVGDKIDVCVTEKNKNRQIDADVVLSREPLTDDPWEHLMDDVWVKDATIEVRCVEIPKDKTYWWGVCEQIEDIDLMGNYSNRCEITVGQKYRCKIVECNKDKRIFKVVPFAVVNEDTTAALEDDSVVENKAETDHESTAITADMVVSRIDQLFDSGNSPISNKGGVREIIDSYNLADDQLLALINSVIRKYLSEKKPEMAYEIFKSCRIRLFRLSADFNMIISFIEQIVGQLRKNGNSDLIDSVYDELLIFIKANSIDFEAVNTEVYTNAFRSAINYYIEGKDYANAVKYISVMISKLSQEHPAFNTEYSRFYYFKGIIDKANGDYSSAKSNFYFSLKYANKDKGNKFAKMAATEMQKCNDLLKEKKASQPSNWEAVDKYFRDLKYEEAYHHFQKLYNNNPEDDEIAEIYKKTSEVYERAQNRKSTLPLAEKKGVNYRKATAAESIEINLERAAELWRECIEKGEPGRLYAASELVVVLCKVEKYYDALEAYEKYARLFKDAIDLYTFRVRAFDIYKKMGAYDVAIVEGLKIEEEYAKNKAFIEKGGKKRLATLLQSIASLQSKEMGLYAVANNTLERALSYGLDKGAYATAYINNCISNGQYELVKSLLNEYANDLSSEFIASVKKSLSSSDNSDDEIVLADQNLIQINDLFFDWYTKKNIEICPDVIKSYFEEREYKSIQDIFEHISKYENYNTNLSAKQFLLVLAANYVLSSIDGYSSQTYYEYIYKALKSEMEIRDNTSRKNLYLYKYAAIAAYMMGDHEAIKQTIQAAFISFPMGRESIIAMFSNNPILKDDEYDMVRDNIENLKEATHESTPEGVYSYIEEAINQYADKQSEILMMKDHILGGLGTDYQETDADLIDLSKRRELLSATDLSIVERLIEINRCMMGITKQRDYMSLDMILSKSADLVNRTLSDVDSDITSMSLLMWIDVLKKWVEVIKLERNNINTTLKPELSVKIDNNMLFASSGEVTIDFVLKNMENCASASSINISFMDESGTLITGKDLFIDRLLGGESKALSQTFTKDSSFVMNVRIRFKDQMNAINECSHSESITINKENGFEYIENPFSKLEFDPRNDRGIFVGRDEIISNLCSQLVRGTSRCILLYGQKRIGKTSIFRVMEKKLSDQFFTVYLLMPIIYSMDDFYTNIKYAIYEKEDNEEYKEKLLDLYENFAITNPTEFRVYLAKVKKILNGKELLVLLDEFADLYDMLDTSFPKQFINFLNNSLQLRLFSALITGKETIIQLFDRFGNAFKLSQKVHVGYIEKRFFRDLIDKPIYRKDGKSRYDERSIEYLWNLTKGQPYLSQIIGGRIVEYLNRNKIENISEATISRVVDEYLSTVSSDDFDSFYCKYNDNGPEHADEIKATKVLLRKIADECSFNGNHTCDVSRIHRTPEEQAIFADLINRNVVVNDNGRCEIYVGLLYEWLRVKGDSIIQETYDEIVNKREEQTDNTTITYNTTNIYGDTVSGDKKQIVAETVIENQVNNTVITLDKAIVGLEELQKFIESSSNNPQSIQPELLDQINMIPSIGQTWAGLDDEDADQKIDEYTKAISESKISKELTEEQKKRFNLTDDILDMLENDCRTQIICGIQVFDLIDYCISNYGLDMGDSESPRAILFARAFEKHMKDCMYAFLGKTRGFNDVKLANGRCLSEKDVDRTTIGDYTYVLDHGDITRLVNMASDRLDRKDLDEQWWKKTRKRLNKIKELRNECCHSGSKFAAVELIDLKELIFDEGSIETVYLFKELDHSTKKEKTATANNKPSATQKTNVLLDPSLIGKELDFVMQKRTSRKNIRGMVSGKYPASIPVNEAKKVEFAEGKHVKVRITQMHEDEMYIVEIVG